MTKCIIDVSSAAAAWAQNPARQAAIFAGLPESVGAFTVSKILLAQPCKAVMLAEVPPSTTGGASLVVAGGMENMTRSPYLLTRAREGYRLGHGELLDSMILDGLSDAYGQKHMGTCGELCAVEYHFNRAEQDDFAVRSHTRARQAIATGVFETEIVPVEISAKGNATNVVAQDEGPAKFDETKLRALKPAFGTDGTITAGNASSISDGAAALLVASPEQCRAARLRPIAEIKGSATWSQQPEWFTTAPVVAIRLLLEKLDWSIDRVDLFEINEAFAVVTMVAERELGIPTEKVNIYGGAIALGHPIGCSGARVLVTLLNAFKRTGGYAEFTVSLCIAGVTPSPSLSNRSTKKKPRKSKKPRTFVTGTTLTCSVGVGIARHSTF